MKTITFHCETITPMFLSGANGKTPELRPPSIKGAMRFWWRALNGDLSLEQLKKKEAEIFGGGGENATRSKMVINIEEYEDYNIEDWISDKTFKQQKNEYGDIYYLAFGVYDRKYIKIGFKFKITCVYDIIVEKEIFDSFYLLFKYGGLGSKSRNGFGQITLLSEFNHKLDYVFDNKINDNKFPAFTNSYFYIEESGTDLITIWKTLAQAYKNAITNFRGNNKYKRNFIAKRNNIEQINGTEHFERIAKTFFISFNISENKYLGRIIYLPYKFPVKEEEYTKTIETFSDNFEENL